MEIIHPLEPIYNNESKVLILGTMPSVKSREQEFYYAHPKNRFWKTLSKVYNEEIGTTTKERKDFLYKHNIALFDVLKSCEINGSSDNSIKNPIPNDLSEILNRSNYKSNFYNRKKSL